MSVSNPMQSLSLSAGDLDAMRRSASSDPKGSARQAAVQFETLFMQQLLKQMRDTVPQGGLVDRGQENTWTGMLDQQFAQKMSGRPGGLAQVIEKQLLRALEPAAGPAAASATRPSPSATMGLPVGTQGLPVKAAAPQGFPVDARYGARGYPVLATAVQQGFAVDRRPVPQEAFPLRGGASVAPPQTGASAQAPANPEAGQSAQAGRQAFVDRVWQHAVKAEHRTGVPAAFVVGQAALESGWGRRELKGANGSASHNLFGIKAGAGWTGATVDSLTTEYIDGQPHKVVQKFRAYASYAQAFEDWSALMRGQSRYAPALQADTAAEFAQRIGASGYATDPAYAQKLHKVIEQAAATRGRAM